jgi:hypothetical protein
MNAQMKDERLELNLNGPVKKWAETVSEVEGTRYSMLMNDVIEFSPSGRTTLRASFNQGAILEEKIETTLNQNEEPLTILTSTMKGLVSRKEFHYNAMGKLEYINEFDGTDQLQRRREVQLDSQGRIIAERILNGRNQQTGSLNILYSSNGLRVEELHRGPTGYLLKMTIQVFDEAGRKIRMEQIEPIKRVRENDFIKTWEFDHAGRLTRELELSHSGEIRKEMKFDYDDNGYIQKVEEFGLKGKQVSRQEVSVSPDGLIADMKLYSGIGNLLQTVREERKEDSHKNIIEIKRFQDNVLKMYIRRNIEYFSNN